MNFKQLHNELTQSILSDLKHMLPKHDFAEVYQYSLLPAGKFFRPLLALSIFEDFKIKLSSEQKMAFAKSLEYHHTYTLIHDDLPSMDNDDFRRGRESTHKKYGEWRAILSGDGLLNLSYQALAQANCKSANELIKFIAWCLGPKGLIQGQVLDLSEEMNNGFMNVIETHKLKTSRLLQCACVGPLYFKENKTFRESMDMYKLGHNLGIVFQLLDDLGELTDEFVGEHELAINPYLKYGDMCIKEIAKSLSKVQEMLLKYELFHTQNFLQLYFDKNKENLDKKREILNKNLSHQIKNNGLSLSPIMSLLSRV